MSLRIPLSAPDITRAEIEAVTSVLQTPSLSMGPRVPEFEQSFAGWLGSKHAVAVSSGTAGLHLALRAAGVDEGDEVITTPLSFVASVNAILYQRARPVFVDVEPRFLDIDAAGIEAAITPRTRAILPVHLFGQPAAMAPILEIAARHRLAVVEDACEALGGAIGGRKLGTLGTAGVFGFYPNKPITTGEGGMIVTDDGALAALCRSLRNHGREDDSFEYPRLGFNYRLSELAAALGTVQVSRLDGMMARRAAVARRYHQALASEPSIVRPEHDRGDARVGWFAYVVRLADDWTEGQRNRVLVELRARGIGCQRYFTPLHRHPHVRAAAGTTPSCPIADEAAARTLALPFFNTMSEAAVDEVAATLGDVLRLVRHSE